MYLFIGIGTITAAAILSELIIALIGGPGVIGVIISGILIALFAKIMPAKTKKGVEEYYKVLGLEEFIKTAEKDRMARKRKHIRKITSIRNSTKPSRQMGNHIQRHIQRTTKMV